MTAFRPTLLGGHGMIGALELAWGPAYELREPKERGYVMGARAVVRLGEETHSFPHFWERVFGSERPFMVLREGILEHVRMARQDLGMQYVRAHGIFHDELGVYREVEQQGQRRVVYGWRAVDRIYDRLLAEGIRPFVELSFMPNQVATGSQACFTWQGNVTPPRDYGAWETLVRAFVEHLVDRYGLEEVRTWYFEVWNEPNLEYFWAGTQVDYWRLYDHAARAVKSVDEQLRVGGPATAAGAWVDAFVAHCTRERNLATGGVGSPFDFVSYHGYPTDAGLILGGELISFLGNTYWYELSRRNHAQVLAADRPAEIHVTEWNSLTNPRDLRHDGANQAAFVCKAVADVAGYVDSFSYWTLSDVFEEGAFPEVEFHGGFGLVTLSGIKKPAFNAFRMLHLLGDRRLPLEVAGLPEGAGALATSSSDGLQILLWRYVAPPFGRIQPLTVQTVDQEEVGDPLRVEVEVQGAGDRRFQLEEYLVDREHSNAFTAWRELGAPARPDETQLAALRDRMELERVRLVRGVRPEGGVLSLRLTLPPAGAVLVTLTDV